MRKLAILSVLALLPLLLSAQPQRPRPEDLSDEELISMQTRDMANWLGLESKPREQFISTYSAFKGEINAILKNAKPAQKEVSEEEIDQALKKNFEVSEKILDIRKSYYEKFKSFLKPSQIRQMYHYEREAGRRMMEGPKNGHRRGPKGPDGQGCPDGQAPQGDPGMMPPPGGPAPEGF